MKKGLVILALLAFIGTAVPANAACKCNTCYSPVPRNTITYSMPNYSHNIPPQPPRNSRKQYQSNNTGAVVGGMIIGAVAGGVIANALVTH